jgi:hypothetical protein
MLGMATFEDAQGAKPHVLQVLIKTYPEVSGLGITRVGNGWGFKVNLTRPRQLPDQLDGVPLLPEVVGEVIAHQFAP